jgi:hypothetical protein
MKRIVAAEIQAHVEVSMSVSQVARAGKNERVRSIGKK